MIAKVWRFFVAVADWRTALRKLTGRPIVDVVFITNMRDKIDRKRYLGDWHPACGHFNGPRYWIDDISGRTRALDITTKEMGTVNGRRRAKELFISAVRWAQANGAKVVLFAAGTKRIFDETEMLAIKNQFPEILFTIGDNGTMSLLKQETLHALGAAGLKPGYCKVGILGPYGFLGEMMTKELKNLGYDIVGVGPNTGGLESVREKYGIATCQTIAEMGLVDAVVACTHSETVRLTAENIKYIRREARKLLLVDVAEPSNMTKVEYEKCEAYVVRQDAGNAYSPRLKYVLGAISYRLFRLTRGVTFGCFAEALTLATALNYGESVEEIDWLTVNDESMKIVADLFQRHTFMTPMARCFGRLVRGFYLVLDFESRRRIAGHSSWRLAAEKLHLL